MARRAERGAGGLWEKLLMGSGGLGFSVPHAPVIILLCSPGRPGASSSRSVLPVPHSQVGEAEAS